MPMLGEAGRAQIKSRSAAERRCQILGYRPIHLAEEVQGQM